MTLEYNKPDQDGDKSEQRRSDADIQIIWVTASSLPQPDLHSIPLFIIRNSPRP
tara:strand:- start:1038 stop:1199 length:162 start_codon:yes stop_codon:yes gene_type:complete